MAELDSLEIWARREIQSKQLAATTAREVVERAEAERLAAERAEQAAAAEQAEQYARIIAPVADYVRGCARRLAATLLATSGDYPRGRQPATVVYKSKNSLLRDNIPARFTGRRMWEMSRYVHEYETNLDSYTGTYLDKVREYSGWALGPDGLVYPYFIAKNKLTTKGPARDELLVRNILFTENVNPLSDPELLSQGTVFRELTSFMVRYGIDTLIPEAETARWIPPIRVATG